jgi:hypothetical protein
MLSKHCLLAVTVRSSSIPYGVLYYGIIVFFHGIIVWYYCIIVIRVQVERAAAACPVHAISIGQADDPKSSGK